MLDHCSIRMKNECLWNGDGGIALIEIVIERERGESHLVVDRMFVDKIFDRFDVFFFVVFVGQPDDDQPIFAIFFREVDKVWNLLATRTTPLWPSLSSYGFCLSWK